MIAGLPLTFAQPLLLLGLLSLPVLWWLLRVMPPRPRRIEFPPTRLLFDIAPREETPSRSPWWLTLLRLIAAALVIFAAAGPIWNQRNQAAGSKAPLVLLLDDSWSAASSWESRIKAADEVIANADADRRGQNDRESAARRSERARRYRARARCQGLADRRGAVQLRPEGPRHRGRVRSPGRTAQ